MTDFVRKYVLLPQPMMSLEKKDLSLRRFIRYYSNNSQPSLAFTKHSVLREGGNHE